LGGERFLLDFGLKEGDEVDLDDLLESLMKKKKKGEAS